MLPRPRASCVRPSSASDFVRRRRRRISAQQHFLPTFLSPRVSSDPTLGEERAEDGRQGYADWNESGNQQRDHKDTQHIRITHMNHTKQSQEQQESHLFLTTEVSPQQERSLLTILSAWKIRSVLIKRKLGYSS